MTRNGDNKLNKTKKFYRMLVSFIALTGMLILTGCHTEYLSAPELDAQSQQNYITTTSAEGKEIRLFSFGKTGGDRFNKTTATQQWINKNTGGSMSMRHSGNEIQASFYLKVAAGAIDYSKTISMAFDDLNNQGFTDVVFGPHGTQFSSPALLSIKAAGLDLSGVDPNNVHLYYINDDGQWEEMICGSIYVDVARGYAVVMDAQLNHFSRYALGAD